MITPEIISGRLGNKMFQLAYIVAQVKDGRIPDIYIQDPKYFEKYADEIKELFREGIGYLSQVGIHVRRAANPINPNECRYADNPFYVNLADETDYYERAMAMFLGENFLIFSDDPEFCKKRFKGPNIQVMEKGNEVDDLNLLASCKHQIIANSSFSWWAAYLNPNESKKIIAPKQWYRDGIERTRCPLEWERI